ncbi:uncharacterized protein LOC100834356 isoform X1 [Brachypodium distachyon]|uniref:DUF7806 domain-containing protein n=2 Tax=Brachypodium distachyon TaxID=15368 RepID=A0A0Q3JKK2_BRADI|nr:uncharacterized protein LOC100834356 isoform X1 [Brachypodium distachyon]KQK12676.1 hypothetical protein BRADI_1g05306v3 [Brachypodium distachyon]|eukprot:XP_014753215.1 uncharacterized protein LOC100834356 isoform X1 [Brachypodium distachyon]
MENLNVKLHKKYTGLKKRKLLDDDGLRKRELEMLEELKKMAGEVQNLRDENDRLRDELIDKEKQLAETRILVVDREQQLSETQTLLVEETSKTKEFETEILRLKSLFAEKNDTDNYTTPVSPATIPEVVIQNQTPVSPAKRTPKSNRANKVPSSANAIVRPSNFHNEATELDCCRRDMHISGNGNEESSSCVYHMLAESLVGMKLSLKNEMEGFSLSFYHESSGYNFTLTWLEQPHGGEWAYSYSSLGTLERVALKWLKVQNIRFSMTMCPVFFQRILRLLGQVY